MFKVVSMLWQPDDFAYFQRRPIFRSMSTFSRNERLKSRKLISRIFKEGQSYVAYPLRVVWLPVDAEGQLATGFGDTPAQLAISVPKRSFKTAVARNLLKRRIREAYRLNKNAWYEKLGAGNLHLALMLVYVAKEELPYADIENGIKKMVKKFPGL